MNEVELLGVGCAVAEHDQGVQRRNGLLAKVRLKVLRLIDDDDSVHARDGRHAGARLAPELRLLGLLVDNTGVGLVDRLNAGYKELHRAAGLEEVI